MQSTHFNVKIEMIVMSVVLHMRICTAHIWLVGLVHIPLWFDSGTAILTQMSLSSSSAMVVCVMLWAQGQGSIAV